MIKVIFKGIKKCLYSIGIVFVALFVIFQEWGWEPLKKLFVWLLRWPLWQKVSNYIASLPPYGALACFSIPIMVDEAIKIIGLLQIVQGHGIRGSIIIVLAKILGTALVAWIYQITESKLLQIPWFARFHAWWIPWKNELVAKVKSSTFWQRGHVIVHASKLRLCVWVQWIKSYWNKYFDS